MEKSDKQVIVICSHALVIQLMIQYLTLGRASIRELMVAPLPGVLTIIQGKEIKEINFNLKSLGPQ